MLVMSSNETPEPLPAFEGRVKAIAYDAKEFQSWFLNDHPLPKFSAAPPADIHQGQRISSLGILDELPYEILPMIAGHLDFRSLGRLMQVSLEGWKLVKNLRAYKDVMEYTPDTLAAFVKADTTGYHSATTLYSALRSSKCATCEDVGPFLNLLTCRRSCYFCMNHNFNAHFVPRAMAVSFFELTASDVKTLPSLQVTLGGKFKDHTPDRTLADRNCQDLIGEFFYMTRQNVVAWAEDSFRMVSVGAASALADRVHGPKGYARHHFESADGDDADRYRHGVIVPRGTDEIEMMKMRELARCHELAEILTLDMSDPKWNNRIYPFALYVNVGYIPLPSLNPHVGVVPRFYCGGCDWYCDHETWRHELDESVSPTDIIAETFRLERMAEAAQWRPRTEAEFLKHIKDCAGAQFLLSLSARDWRTSSYTPDSVDLDDEA